MASRNGTVRAAFGGDGGAAGNCTRTNLNGGMAVASDPVTREAVIDDICQAVAELPNRTSPDDEPDMMLITAKELATILRDHLRLAPVPPSGPEPAEPPQAAEPTERERRQCEHCGNWTPDALQNDECMHCDGPLDSGETFTAKQVLDMVTTLVLSDHDLSAAGKVKLEAILRAYAAQLADITSLPSVAPPEKDK